ncbi:MAG: InlB B-repeat-containing protein, partial [Clostridia bacterium]|nr:InlB B-repeat-containing protein [Clostridia bacterium]
TLTFDASVFSSDLGVTSFSLTITNYSTTLNDIGVTFENATIKNNASNSTVITLDNSETLQITPTGIVEVTMKKVVPINLGLTGVSINYAESNVFEDGGHYAPIGEDLKIVIDLEDNYENPQYSLGGNSPGTVSGNTITIDSSNISAGVNLNIQAQQQTYTIIFNGNGATSGSMADEMFNIGSSYNLPANTFTKTEHNFTGWKDSAGNSYTDKQSVKDLAGAGETITLTAQWQVKTYTLTFSISATSLSWGLFTGVVVTDDDSLSFTPDGGYETKVSFKTNSMDAGVTFTESNTQTAYIKNQNLQSGYTYLENYQYVTTKNQVYTGTFDKVPAGYKVFIIATNACTNKSGIKEMSFYENQTPKKIKCYWMLNADTTYRGGEEVDSLAYTSNYTYVITFFEMPNCNLNISATCWTSSIHSGGGAS